MKINVGAIYSTKSDKYPRVRVISERGCKVHIEKRKVMRLGVECIEKHETYEPVGYCVQPIGCDTMAPVFFVDLDGVYDVENGLYLVEQMSEPAERYVLREKLPKEEKQNFTTEK